MTHLKTILLSAAAAAFAASAALADGIMAMDPFAFATAKTARAGGAYVSLMNHGPADRLIGARSNAAKRVELHQHIADGDVMRMREVEGGLELPEGGAIEMAPGGYHIMLMGLNAPLDEGASFPVTLVFESGAELTVDVAVRSRSEGGMGHGGHGDQGAKSE